MARFLFVFVFIVSLHASATLRSQNKMVTLQVKGANLEEVIQSLKLQTDYGFFYNIDNEEIRKVTGLDINMREASVEEVLDRVLQGTRLTYTVVNGVVIIKLKSNTADEKKKITVKGKVVDKENIPLPGVTVKVVGTSMGTATNMDGAFTLELPEGKYSLEFSFVGYKTVTRPVVEGKEVAVVLEEDVSELNEVVVTGYFTKSKSSYTGAVKTVSGEQLKAISGTNVITALAALTPGLNLVERNEAGSNPNRVPELLLRGMSSFSDGATQVNQPTIILDGVEISMQELYDLDMNEIESITVLKDASATALYGSRAASGVIVVERKKLAEGNMRVAYTFTGNVQFPYLKDYKLLNAADKLEYERQAGLYTSEVTKDPWGVITNEGEQYKLDEAYNQRYQEVQRGVDTDWLSQPARTGFSHDHSLRLYGGASNIRYELSGRFNNVQGVMKEDYRRRYSLGFKLEYYLQSKLVLSNRTTYNEVDNKLSPYGSFSSYTLMNPYDRIRDADGKLVKEMSWGFDNPLYEASLGSYDKSTDKSFANTLDVRWDVNKLFRVTANFNITVDNTNQEVFKSPESQTFKDETEISKKGSMEQTNGHGVSYAGTLTGAFNKMTEDNSLISVTAGMEVRKAKQEATTLTGIGFFDDELSFAGQAVGYPTTSSPTGTQAISTEIGFFANANYMYNNRYYADFVYRVTGSSKFGANNRYGNFWSGGLGWNLHNESFIQSDKIDLLKIRGSVGYTGKVNFEPFQAMTIYHYTSDLDYKNGIGAVPQGIGNVDLAWEREFSYNIGTDVSLFGRRLNLTFDAYWKRTKDLVLDGSRAPSTGTASAKENVGEMENKGFDFQVDGMLVQRDDFYWQVGLIGSANKNKILKINSALKKANADASKVESVKPLAQYEEGESTSALKVVRSAGIDPATGKEVYFKLDGTRTFEYSGDDKVVVGDKEPKFQGSVSTSLYYKGFSLYVLGTFKCGGYLYNETRAQKVEGANPKQNADERVFSDRWKGKGDIAFYRDIKDKDTWGTSPKHTDRFVEKENVFTLGTVNLAYEFGQDFCSRIGVRNLRIGVNLTDILRFSSVKMERGTDYLFSNGFEFTLGTTF